MLVRFLPGWNEETTYDYNNNYYVIICVVYIYTLDIEKILATSHVQYHFLRAVLSYTLKDMWFLLISALRLCFHTIDSNHSRALHSSP